jgi:fumarate reductase flavoprotein subunit
VTTHILNPDGLTFPITVPVLIIGAGACGLTAALAAHESGAEVMVLERDAKPSGSTAMSSGMIPAAGTRFQRAKGVADSPEILSADIMAKNHHRADPKIVRAVAEESASTIEWLADSHGVPFELVEGFLYPGHSQLRMHAPPSRTGAELMNYLLRAAKTKEIEIVTEARVRHLFARADGTVVAVRMERPDGALEDVGCKTLILACNGYGGNREMVREHIPEMADASYFGHPGNTGDAVIWGRELGATCKDMSAYQGHGSIADPHAVLITWALMMEGGIQVNANGLRFSNEQEGYSEQAAKLLQQPGGFGWDIYDQRIHELGLQFEDYRLAQSAGAVRKADSVEKLASVTDLPLPALESTLSSCHELAAGVGSDRCGRNFVSKPALEAPYFAIRVTGALLHTQGGLEIDVDGRVLRPDGIALPNLLAAGGAARGLSGPDASGYLSGNGLLSAAVLGRICGRRAASLATNAAD